MKIRIAAFLVPLLLVAGYAIAQKPASAPQRPADTTPAKAESTDAKVIAFQRPSYPLDTCPISHEKLGGMGEPVDMVVEGRLVRLCCGSCKKGVTKDPAAVIKLIDEAVVAKQSVGYPLETCPISGKKIETPVNHVVGTRLVRFCCNNCPKTFDSDPAKQAEAMQKLDAAWIASQKAKYTVTTCPVSGEALDAKAVDHLYGTRLVRLCCPDCVKELEAKPDQFLAKLDALQKAVPAAAPKEGEKKGGDKKGE